ncbi:MAG: phosphoglycerate kinase, partial [Alphaproteobacteria bacterium]
MPKFKTIDALDPRGKTVLLRADLNVPMENGKVGDLTRIERTVPTIRELAGKGAKVVVLSHFGRPKGKREPSMSLKPVAEALAAVLGAPVAFADDCVGPEAEKTVAGLAAGGVALLENLRYHAEEEKNDGGFAGRLAALGDTYVNDAFSAAHRAHASTEALAQRLPAYAGRLMQEELDALGRALEHPERPVMAIVGGAKVSTKIDLLQNLIGKVDMLVIGGGMANTFLHALGTDVGKSLCEKDLADTARGIVAAAKGRGCEIVLPVDAAVAVEFKAGAASAAVAVGSVPADRMILDVGPESIADLKRRLAQVRTLVWNGPLGAFEIEPFDAGTNAVARAAADLTAAGRLVSVAGGGDTVAALARAGVEDRFTYVST